MQQDCPQGWHAGWSPTEGPMRRNAGPSILKGSSEQQFPSANADFRPETPTTELSGLRALLRRFWCGGARDLQGQAGGAEELAARDGLRTPVLRADQQLPSARCPDTSGFGFRWSPCLRARHRAAHPGREAISGTGLPRLGRLQVFEQFKRFETQQLSILGPNGPREVCGASVSAPSRRLYKPALVSPLYPIEASGKLHSQDPVFLNFSKHRTSRVLLLNFGSPKH